MFTENIKNDMNALMVVHSLTVPNHSVAKQTGNATRVLNTYT